ncbi:hypothetical protein Hanom_Chr06g00572401 [Helianthus anomalus]
MVQVVYEVDRRWRRTLELGFRPVTISQSRSGFRTMYPATCHPGYALRQRHRLEDVGNGGVLS